MDLCVWAGLQWVVTTLRFVLGSERKNNLEVHRINLAQMHQIINRDSVIAPSPSLTVSLPSMTSLPQSLLLFICLYYYSIPEEARRRSNVARSYEGKERVEIATLSSSKEWVSLLFEALFLNPFALGSISSSNLFVFFLLLQFLLPSPSPISSSSSPYQDPNSCGAGSFRKWS